MVLVAIVLGAVVFCTLAAEAVFRLLRWGESPSSNLLRPAPGVLLALGNETMSSTYHALV